MKHRFSFAGILDVEHRPAGSVGELLKGDRLELGPQAPRDISPGLADRGTGFAVGADRIGQQAGIDGVGDLGEVDRAGLLGEQVAAGLAAPAGDQSAAPQVIEDLDQKVCRDGFALRQFLKPCNGPAVMTLRELGKGPAGVLEFL